MQRRTWLGALAGSALGALTLRSRAAAPAAPTAWRDLLDTPAQASLLAARSLITGLARAGQRVVAVGQRGHVLTSDDAGQHWQQASVPVSCDLTAVSFATPSIGWAVGHDGIVLRSTDAGRSWARVLDGRSLGELLVAHYTRSGDEKWLAEARRFAAQGAENPWLDVSFADAQTGHLVGAFGLMLRTTDGGQHWEPLLHATDNPKALHLYAVRQIGGELYVAGEQGLLMRQDRASGRFTALSLPYAGSLFGLVGNDRAVLAYGLRGHVLRSTDGGRNWAEVPSGLAVGLTAATLDERGRILIASQAGHLIASTDDGASFAPLKTERAQPAAAVVNAGSGRLVLAGPRGVQSLALS